jgi:hypothetical protein
VGFPVDVRDGIQYQVGIRQNGFERTPGDCAGRVERGVQTAVLQACRNAAANAGCDSGSPADRRNPAADCS